MGAAVSCGLEGSVVRARRGDTGRSRRLAVDVDVARRASRVRAPTVGVTPCSTCSGPRSSPSGWTRSVSERCRGHAMAGETYKTLMDCNYLLFPCVLCIPNSTARRTSHGSRGLLHRSPRRAKPQPRHGDTYVFDTRALRVHVNLRIWRTSSSTFCHHVVSRSLHGSISNNPSLYIELIHGVARSASALV